jgi:hypothetical protein
MSPAADPVSFDRSRPNRRLDHFLRQKDSGNAADEPVQADRLESSTPPACKNSSHQDLVFIFAMYYNYTYIVIHY